MACAVRTTRSPDGPLQDGRRAATDPTTGETHLRHHVTADGYYRGKKVIDTKSKVADEE